MINPTLILVVSEDSTVRFLCETNSTAELHSLSYADVVPVPVNIRTVAADGRKDELPYGVHVLVGRPFLGIGCEVLSGEVAMIVPTGGEDPWPTPPPPKQQELDDGSESVDADGGESPFPTPPPPMSAAMREYVTLLRNTPR
jgi:hypothetical protein